MVIMQYEFILQRVNQEFQNTLNRCLYLEGTVK